MKIHWSNSVEKQHLLFRMLKTFISINPTELHNSPMEQECFLLILQTRGWGWASKTLCDSTLGFGPWFEIVPPFLSSTTKLIPCIIPVMKIKSSIYWLPYNLWRLNDIPACHLKICFSWFALSLFSSFCFPSVNATLPASPPLPILSKACFLGESQNWNWDDGAMMPYDGGWLVAPNECIHHSKTDQCRFIHFPVLFLF